MMTKAGEQPTITQADWDAALYIGSRTAEWLYHFLPEYLARHRIANQPPAQDGLVEALRKIAQLDVPRPVAVQYMPDRPSKHDKCAHDVWMYDECGNCISDFATAALASLGDKP